MSVDLRPYFVRGLIATASGRNNRSTHNVGQAKQQSITYEVQRKQDWSKNV